MDYIYKNSNGEKCIGSVERLIVTPLFDFSVEVNGKTMWCQMDHSLTEWCIHLISINRSAELAYPTDVLWNTESLYGILGDKDISMQIAYAIKAVFEELNHCQ